MLIVTHVAIALLGIVQATYGLFFPSSRKLQLTYAFTIATFVTGSYLVWHLHTPVLQSCMSGLVYLGFMITASLIARYRLLHGANLGSEDA